jgi:glycosyltransferase involved in cell wall biosynthesis
MNQNKSISRVLVLIPVLNEATSIGSLATEIKTRYPDFDLLVVDDGSTDDSAELARRGGAVVIQHPFNLGDGGARQTGFYYAQEKGYNFLVHLDGDSQHSPAEITLLLKELHEGNADLVVGSRFLGRCDYRLGGMKKIGIRLFSLICSLAVGQRITDPTSGFRALNRKAIELFASGYYPQHYPDADVIISSHFNGLTIKEVPVTMSRTRSVNLHRGGKIVYYIYKMFLSTFISILGDSRRRKRRCRQNR